MALLDAWAAALQATALSAALRASIWAYPLINAGHIVGIALLFGAIVPLDLRLAGSWRSAPLASLWRMLRPVAVCGLLLAACCGVLMFAARPQDYISSPLFGTKMALMLLALVNALLLERAVKPALAALDAPAEPLPAAWRVAGVASIALWFAVIVIGRLIGYR